MVLLNLQYLQSFYIYYTNILFYDILIENVIFAKILKIGDKDICVLSENGRINVCNETDKN